jgi:hypothetical protein
MCRSAKVDARRRSPRKRESKRKVKRQGPGTSNWSADQYEDSNIDGGDIVEGNLRVIVATQTREDDWTVSNLCRKCCYIFEHLYEVPLEIPIVPFGPHAKLTRGFTFSFYHNTSSIRSNAKKGCHLCIQLLEGIRYRLRGKEATDVSIPSGQIFIMLKNFEKSGQPVLLFDISGIDENGDVLHFTSYLHVEENGW